MKSTQHLFAAAVLALVPCMLSEQADESHGLYSTLHMAMMINAMLQETREWHKNKPPLAAVMQIMTMHLCSQLCHMLTLTQIKTSSTGFVQTVK